MPDDDWALSQGTVDERNEARKSANRSEQTLAPSKPYPEPNQREERVYPDGTVTDALGNFVGIDQPAAVEAFRAAH